MRKQRIISLLLALCLLVGIMPTAAWAEGEISGSCGVNATWSFDEATGALTISGTGKMGNYWRNDAPWCDFRERITNIVIENGITSIGGEAFYKCSSLTKINIPESVTTIGERAFMSCYSLQDVMIPSGIDFIGNDTFYGCCLNRVVFAGPLTTISNASNVSEMDLFTLGDHSATIHGYDFELNLSLYDGVSQETYADWFYHPFEAHSFENGICTVCGTSVIIERKYGDNLCWSYDCESGALRVFGNGAMEESNNPPWNRLEKRIATVSIEDGVTSIADNSFYGCDNLTYVTLPDSLTNIGSNAFKDCVGLTSVIFSGSVPDFGWAVFAYVTATAYYPENNPTWTDDVMQNYGGTITWVPYAEGTTPWDNEQPTEPEPTEPVENPFTDVPADKYYHDPVLWAYSNGITTGATATTFNPNGNCTRGQIVTFLWRAAGKPEPTLTENPFTDVDSDDYFYKAVLWAVEEGITTGATATTFNPKGDCNRAQVVTFMYRAAGSPAITGTDNPFEDVPSDKYYHDAVLWAVEQEITNGTSPTKFSPNNICNRGQIVTFLYRGYAD